MHIHWIANGIVPPPQSMGGGDRIMVECVRRWKKNHRITIYGWEGTQVLCDYQKLKGVEHVLWSAKHFCSSSFPILFAAQTWNGRHYAKKISFDDDEQNVLISNSDFPPDALPAQIIKHRYPHIPWIAAFYLFAPRWLDILRGRSGPGFLFTAYRPIQRWILRGLLRSAEMILVTGEEDRQRMIQFGRTPESIYAVRGGVDLSILEQVPEPIQKQYDAVFVGRFHPQKGVRQLLEIWNLVCKKKPDARLAMIGVGPLEAELREKRDQLGLQNAIDFLGFLDGTEKYQVIKASRVVVHPAIYDSGGMAAAEALACGLPGVAFDLSSLKSYYPKGFLKAALGDFSAFASHIFQLITQADLYGKMSAEAKAVGLEWNWDNRAHELWQTIEKRIIISRTSS